MGLRAARGLRGAPSAALPPPTAGVTEPPSAPQSPTPVGCPPPPARPRDPAVFSPPRRFEEGGSSTVGGKEGVALRGWGTVGTLCCFGVKGGVCRGGAAGGAVFADQSPPGAMRKSREQAPRRAKPAIKYLPSWAVFASDGATFPGRSSALFERTALLSALPAGSRGHRAHRDPGTVPPEPTRGATSALERSGETNEV